MIDPNLLQLIGLGSIDDPDIDDGRHLRWMFHRLLGFPRTGFELRRRPSLVDSDFNPHEPGMPSLYVQPTRQPNLGTGTRIRFSNGLTVSKVDGFTYGPPESSSALTIAGKPLKLDFGAEGSPPREPRSNPAAYVLLTIARRSRTGSVIARGYYDARPRLRLVDQAGISSDSRFDLGDLSDIRTVGNSRRAFSSADRSSGEGAIVRRDSLAHESIVRRGLEVRSRAENQANPFVYQTLLLHGGLLEHIQITGFESYLVEVKWITTENLIAAGGWRVLDTYYLPLTHEPALYPHWTTEDNEEVARKRLQTSPLKRQPPWDREDGGTPPLLLNSVSTSVFNSLRKRYLGIEFRRVEDAMHTFLKGELTEIVPQALVTTTETLTPEEGDESGPEPMDVTISPFDLLYGASADPSVARELGLSMVDRSNPNGIYDYAVHAGFSLLWLRWILTNKDARETAQRMREELGGALANLERREFAPVWISSVITGLKQTAAVKLEPPSGVAAEVIPDATRLPVQARVRINWPRGRANLFEAPNQTRVLHVFKRESDAGDVLLHHRDDDNKLLAPHLPTPYGYTEQRLNLTDRQVPNYGVHTWKIAAMDLFGRLSDDAVISTNVRDTLAPPPPANVQAVLEGDATTGAWTKLVVGFDWLPSHESVAPDFSFFELHVRQGLLNDTQAPLPATWGKLEMTPGSTAGPIRIFFAGPGVTHVPAGITANVSATDLDVGGKRVTVELSPVACPFDSTGYAHLAAAVRAFDEWDNTSGFAVARAERVDLSVPPPPDFGGEPNRTTRPDAQNRSWFRFPIPVVPGASVRVLRASSVALLSASNTEPADFAALSEHDQVGMLRTLSVVHREPFATDHEQPLPANGTPHLMEFNGFDRGLTVVTALMMNAAGAQSTWPSSPTAFMVIKVARDVPPPAPLISEVRAGDGGVVLSIAPDDTGLTRSLAVYRARSEADASDVRRMRPVREVPVAASGGPTQVTDSGLFDEVNYFYRVVAIGEDQLRSVPSGVATVRLVAPGPPPAPVVTAIERDATAPARRRVRLTVPRRDYAVYLFRRPRFATGWEIPNSPALNEGKLNFTELTTVRNPGGYEVVVNDTVPVAGEIYSYFARIEDPRGRVTAGAPRLETP